MKLRNILTLVVALFIFSCDNELSINSEWKDITVVYGLLDPTLDTNFIRIERGYLGSEPARNSYEKPDSLYYDENEITVTLNWYNIDDNNNRGELVSSRELKPDYTIRSLNDDGPFTTEGYRVYPVISPDIPVSNEFEYELIVDKANGSPQVTATTRVLETFEINIPRDLVDGINFRGTLGWENSEGRIFLYQPRYYFYYKEFNLTTKESEIKEILYKYQDVPRKNTDIDFELALGTDAFYSYIANRIDTDPDVLRFFESMRFEVWAADENLTTYMNLKKPSSGINQNRPDFTNVENGAGIFASRLKVSIEGAKLDDRGTPSFLDNLYQKQSICAKRFAFIEAATADTCICDDLPGTGGNGRQCPYDN
ncbi:MAG: hypothetical protein RLP14_06560 [Owenweeksia sp.]